MSYVKPRKQPTVKEQLTKANKDNARLRAVITTTTRWLYDTIFADADVEADESGEYASIGSDLHEAFSELVAVVEPHIITASHQRSDLMVQSHDGWVYPESAKDQLKQISQHERDMCVGAITDWMMKRGEQTR
jgi:hypothetical protein